MTRLIVILASIAVLFTSNASATTEMGWTSAMETNLTAADTANDAKYEAFKVDVDANACTNDDYGLQAAIMYQVTGTTSYCTDAFNHNAGCDGTANRNKTRDCFVERALAYSWCADVVSGANKTTWESQLDAVVGLVTNAVHGTRPWDTDELMGHYFGCMIYDLAKDGTINQCTTNAISGTFGGVDSTGENTTTLRNAVDLYWSDFSGGTFVEGSEYNKNTIYYTLQGVNAINEFYGTDKFPEITSLYDDIAEFHYQYNTPDYSQHFQFGDVQSGQQRTQGQYRVQVMYDAIAHLDSNDANMWDLWNSLYGSNCVRMPWAMFYKHDATATKDSGQTAFNAAGAGIALWHEDWNVNDTFFVSRYKPFFNADHDWGAFENLAVWRNDDWVIDYPRHYYGDNWNENPWLNSLLVNSGFGRMREAVGQVAYEAGSDYVYHSGVTSGFVQNSGNFSDPPPAWITEHAVQRLFRHNPDGTETIFDYHRLDSCNPSSTDCMTAAKKARLSLGQAAGTSGTSASAYGRAEANSWNHEYVINADSSPSQSGNKFSWNATNGDAIELYSFYDSYTDSTVDLAATSNAVTPYYFTASPVNASEKTGYQLRLEVTAPGARTFVPLLTTIHIEDSGGSADSYTEIYNTTGTESVQGAMVENGTDRVVFLASAEQDLTTTFTSSISGSATTFDPNRFTKAAAMQKFKSDGQASFASDDTKDIEVFIVGLDTGYTWTVLKNGVSAGCTVSANGICNFTITGAVQTHTVTWSVSGATDCDDFCNLCASEGACGGSAQTCYWHNNGGLTSEQCNTEPAPIDNCPTEPTSCSNQSDCETNGYCWYGDACISECPTDPATEAYIYASADTYINQASATTNYDTQNLKVQSSTGSSGSESVNTSTFTLGGADSGFLTQTSSRITASSSQRDNSTNYSYKDYGSGHFGEFDLSFSFNTGSHGSSGLVGILCLSDSGGVTMGGMNSADDGLCVQYGRVLTPDGARIRNYEAGTPTNSSVITLATNTYYYADFDVSTTTATLAIYTDAGKTVHATGSPVTLAVNSGATEKYQYLYGITSGGTEGTATSRSDAYVENILINQADSGGASSTDNNSILRFDLSSLPAGAVIQSVRLDTIWATAGPSTSGIIYAYEGSRAFVENQATWNVYSTGNSWTTAGGRGNGDMVGSWGTSSGSLASYAFAGSELLGSTASFTSSGGFVSLVQNNIGSTINIYLNQALTSTASLFTIYDSENATQGNRPRLYITYTEDEIVEPEAPPPLRTMGGGLYGSGRW